MRGLEGSRAVCVRYRGRGGGRVGVGLGDHAALLGGQLGVGGGGRR